MYIVILWCNTLVTCIYQKRTELSRHCHCRYFVDVSWKNSEGGGNSYMVVNPYEGQRRASIPHRRTERVVHLAKTSSSSTIRGDTGSSVPSGSGTLIMCFMDWWGGLIKVMDAWHDETCRKHLCFLSTKLICILQNVQSLFLNQNG